MSQLSQDHLHPFERRHDKYLKIHEAMKKAKKKTSIKSREAVSSFTIDSSDFLKCFVFFDFGIQNVS